MATAAPSSSSPCSAPASSSPFQFSSLSEANSYRLKAIVERLTFIMNSRSGSIRFDSAEFFNLCVALARGVDYALTINDAPAVTHRLPSLIKQAYQRRDESSLQPAIMMLMISVKNACKNGWFTTADADDLLNMTNELFSSFCMAMSVNPGVGNALDIISVLVSRFYPQFKMSSLIVSFEVKPGYEILMSDFQIARNIPPEEKIMLIVVQTDNLETSSCIISPPHVSFLVNGKGVNRRTNVSLDNGPQFPTDISKMLKFGSNIIQAIGYFTGTYLIALAFMSKLTLCNTPILKDYVQPVVAAVGADSEIIEGASRITLNCPISFRRIKTPVKGHLCKHHQCFDYDNFIVMNSRKPAWRCPCCNRAVSFVDLCIDQNMVKILKEVGQDATDVVISADGSWKAVVEHKGNKDQFHKENLSGQQDCNMSASTGSAHTLTVDIDLTIGEDGQSNSVSQSENHTCEAEDAKPFKNTNDLYFHQFLAGTLTNHSSMTTPPTSQLGNLVWPSILSSSSASDGTHTAQDAGAFGTSEAVLPAVLVNPVIADAISPAHNEEPLAILEPSRPRFGNSMISREPERLPIPRHVNRTPIAVQALPVPSQQPSSFKRMRINGPNLSSLNSNDSSSTTTYQAVRPVIAVPAGHTAASGGMEMQYVSRTSGLSMTQNPELQHVLSLPALNPINTGVPSSLQRGAGAYRSSLQSASDNRGSLVPAPDGQAPQRNPSNLGSLIMSAGAFRSNASLPLGVTRELARQVAQQKLAGAVNPQTSRTAVSSAATADSLRLSPTEELPLDKNWRPTGRMRGSLTGSAYSAALSHYVVPTTQGKPTSSVAPSSSSQLPSSANVVNARVPAAEHASLRSKDLGSDQGGSNT